eukprot:CAMPEP_0113277618 /NCGR_PEP_ID=MMETSP0008_2-20120614/26147_1 /TAXON_ID=97485 /ORGANISM="Prymnesium parvum" /LENGTH=138 /DNA_ID=CAMNT_0000127547 /DNA_START=117 /DNA_END=530 /DNA_ORIENTATION=- /assembly_acc=CAM_ASM_000153
MPLKSEIWICPRRHEQLPVPVPRFYLRQAQGPRRGATQHRTIRGVPRAMAWAREAIPQRVRCDEASKVCALRPQREGREAWRLRRRLRQEEVRLSVEPEDEIWPRWVARKPLGFSDERALTVEYRLRCGSRGEGRRRV